MDSKFKIFPKNKYPIGFILMVGILFTACEPKVIETPQARNERLQKAITQKLDARRAEHQKQCKKDAIVIAEKKVDSILLAEAKLMTIDTITKPIKPTKPDSPIIVPPKDSTAVKPLFDN